MILFEINGDIITTFFFNDLIILLNDSILIIDPMLVIGLPGANIISF